MRANCFARRSSPNGIGELCEHRKAGGDWNPTRPDDSIATGYDRHFFRFAYLARHHPLATQTAFALPCTKSVGVNSSAPT